jgi:hypothetical protein
MAPGGRRPNRDNPEKTAFQADLEPGREDLSKKGSRKRNRAQKKTANDLLAAQVKGGNAQNMGLDGGTRRDE